MKSEAITSRKMLQQEFIKDCSNNAEITLKFLSILIENFLGMNDSLRQELLIRTAMKIVKKIFWSTVVSG